jgi:hypothetical protein
VRPSRVINPHTGAWLEVGAVRVWDASQIYGVAMSRSLGDLQVHPFLIPTPEVSSRLLDDKDRLLILATDGVWDVMDNDEAVDAATSAAPAVACAEIVEKCAKRWDTSMPGRRDDITTVVVDLSHPDCVRTHAPTHARPHPRTHALSHRVARTTQRAACSSATHCACAPHPRAPCHARAARFAPRVAPSRPLAHAHASDCVRAGVAEHAAAEQRQRLVNNMMMRGRAECVARAAPGDGCEAAAHGPAS